MIKVSYVVAGEKNYHIYYVASIVLIPGLKRRKTRDFLLPFKRIEIDDFWGYAEKKLKPVEKIRQFGMLTLLVNYMRAILVSLFSWIRTAWRRN